VAAAVAVIALARGSSSGSLVPLSPNAVAKMNPASGRIVGDVAVGATPTALAGASTGLWVANFRDRTVTELPVRGSQRTLSAGGAPTGICAGAGFLWIALGFQDQVSRVSLRTGTPTAPITVGDGPDAIAFARGAAWIALRIDDTVERVSPSGVAGPPIKVGQAPVALAYAAPYLWVANSLSNSLSRINVQTGARILPDIPLSSPPSQILIYEGSIWVTSELGNTVTRLNPNTDGITKVITTGIPEGPRGIAGASNRVWVTSPLAATITEIDPRRNAAIPSSRLATNPDAIVSWHGSLWITGHPL
jgi:DNA-binding beta-propeller fold protein YncE